MRFDRGLDKKEVFLDYKNINLRFAKNLHFVSGYPKRCLRKRSKINREVGTGSIVFRE